MVLKMKHPDEDEVYASWKAAYYKNYGIPENKKPIAMSERAALETIKHMVQYFLQFDRIDGVRKR